MKRKKISFCCFFVVFFISLGFLYLRKAHPPIYITDQELLPHAAIVYVMFGDQLVRSGSAVIISNRFALTCRHVADPLQIERKVLRELLKDVNLEIDTEELNNNIPEIIDKGVLELPHLGIKRNYSVFTHHKKEFIDLSLLLLGNPLPNIKPLKISDDVEQEDVIRIVGFPGEVDSPEVRSGIVKLAKYGLMVRSTAKTEGGSSGSGTFNSRGELVGIHSETKIKSGYAHSEGAKYILEILKKAGINPRTLLFAK